MTMFGAFAGNLSGRPERADGLLAYDTRVKVPGAKLAQQCTRAHEWVSNTHTQTSGRCAAKDRNLSAQVTQTPSQRRGKHTFANTYTKIVWSRCIKEQHSKLRKQSCMQVCYVWSGWWDRNICIQILEACLWMFEQSWSKVKIDN